MSDPAHEEIEELLGAYALDAVNAEEAALVEAHLDECASCRAELDRHREVTTALANAIEPVPRGLWDRIAAGMSDAPAAGVTRAGEDAPVGGSVTELDAAPGRRSQRTRWLGVVAGVAAALLLGLVAYDLTGSSSPEGGIGTAVQGALANPAHRSVPLSTPAGARLADVVVVPGGQWFITEANMAALPAGRTYQLWGELRGRYISLGLLGRSPSQAAFAVGTSSPSAVAVTVEPAGGVSAPDRPPLATAVIRT